METAFQCRLAADVDRLSQISTLPFRGWEDAPAVSLVNAVHSLPDAYNPTLTDHTAKAEIALKQTQGFSDLHGPGRPGSVERYQFHQEVAAVHLYTQPTSIYSTLNNLLRNGDELTLRQWLPYFRLLMHGMNHVQEQQSKRITVFRGVRQSLLAEYPKDKVFRWDTFTSTTDNARVLENPVFMGTKVPRTLFILTTETGVDIQSLSYFSKEPEILIRPGTIFQVMNVVPRAAGDNGLEIVVATEVGSLARGKSLLKNTIYSLPEYNTVRLLDFEPMSAVPLDEFFTNLGTVTGNMAASPNHKDDANGRLKQHEDHRSDHRSSLVPMDQLFHTSNQAQRVIMYGRPGIGKTTFTSKLINEWRKGRMYSQFQWVLRILLRDCNVINHKDQSLPQLIHGHCMHFSPHLTAAAIDSLLHSRGQYILIILDGYDEYQHGIAALDDLIERRCPQYRDLSVLMTSRSAAFSHLVQNQPPNRGTLFDQAVELVGFGARETKEFVMRYFGPGNHHLAASLNAFLQYRPSLLDVAKVPVFTAMICSLWRTYNNDENRIKSARTITSLYQILEVDLWSRTRSKWGLTSSCWHGELTSTERDKVRQILGQLAWEGLQSKPQARVLFTEDQISSLIIDESMAVRFGVLHGGWISHTGSVSRDGRTQSLYYFLHLTFQEYLAACYLAKRPQLHRVAAVRFVAHTDMTLQFLCGLLGSESLDVLQNVSVDNNSTRLLLLQCCVESNSTKVQSQIGSRATRDGRLNMNQHMATIQEIERLHPILCSSLVAITTIELRDNSLNFELVSALCEGLVTSTSLQRIYLSRNYIADQGAVALGKVLATNTPLLVLHLDTNSIWDEGAAALGKGLAANTNLQDLNLCNNDISDKGAAALVKGLPTNTPLLDLDLRDNLISDEGVAAIEKGLAASKIMLELHLCNNAISEPLVSVRKSIHVSAVAFFRGKSENATSLLSEVARSAPKHLYTYFVKSLGS